MSHRASNWWPSEVQRFGSFRRGPLHAVTARAEWHLSALLVTGDTVGFSTMTSNWQRIESLQRLLAANVDDVLSPTVTRHGLTGLAHQSRPQSDERRRFTVRPICTCLYQSYMQCDAMHRMYSITNWHTIYWSAIVNVAISCTISEIKRDIVGKSWVFHFPCIRRPLRGEDPVGILPYCLVGKN